MKALKLLLEKKLNVIKPMKEESLDYFYVHEY